ncbi:hypothetical protein [Enterobacter genomosp. O]|uniref:hypothetical protein n=1 Tax=Enterobacter genomosp. O TaxID=2364150 RepID=UPI0013F4F107|nr:hypothetical protein [Enterobacter genomosp. O]
MSKSRRAIHRKNEKNRLTAVLLPAKEDVFASRAANPMKNIPTSAFPMADNLRLPFRRLSRLILFSQYLLLEQN